MSEPVRCVACGLPIHRDPKRGARSKFAWSHLRLKPPRGGAFRHRAVPPPELDR